MSDDELIDTMKAAFENVADSGMWTWDAAMGAVLAVVRAHDGDGGRYRWLCANPLWPDAVCVAMSDGDKPALDAAIGAAMRGEK